MIDRLRMVDVYDRLALCTESLGFESFDVSMDLNGAKELALAKDVAALTTMTTSRPLVRSRSHRREERESKFPPPLTWLTGRDGRWRHSMRAVKEDGRLLLTEVRIEQPPEIFRSSRRDGRLRMQLIQSNHEQREWRLRMQPIQSNHEEQDVVKEEEAERWELSRGLQRCHKPVTVSNSQFWPRSLLLDAGVIRVV